MTNKEMDIQPSSGSDFVKKKESLPITEQNLKEKDVEKALERGYAEMTGYMSEEAVDIKAELPEPEHPDGNKPKVNIFLSYSHSNQQIKDAFFNKIRERLKTSKKFKFSFSSDNDIPVGEQWHKSIQEMIRRCDFGLLLLSTNFLASNYIGTHELPTLLEKCLPVALDILDLEDQDLKGLEKRQIFFYENQKSFSEVKGTNQTKFINHLVKKIEGRVTAFYTSQNEAPSVVKNGKDHAIKKHLEQFLEYKASIYKPEEFIAQDGCQSQIAHKADTVRSSDTVVALDYIRSWAIDSDVPYFALLGDFGTGKTFTCRMLAREINTLHEKSHDKYPLCIYLDLRMVATRVGIEKKVPKLLDILQDAIDNTKDPLDRSMVSAEDIIQLVRQNKAMIIYDGLDEKTVHFTPDDTNRFIAELWKIREIKVNNVEDRQGKILISCRTHYFRNILEQNTLFLGRDREGRSPAEYRSCILLPFDDRQIRVYLKKRLACNDGEIEKIIDLFEQVHDLKELSTRPYILSLITEFIPDLERLNHEEKLINTARLYELTIDNWLMRDKGKHEFSVLHKKELMKSLASEIHKRGGASIKAEELEKWLDTWFYNHPVINNAYSNKLRETLQKDLRTATFIIREQENEFSFAHTSLQEYFLAGYILDELLSPKQNRPDLAIAMPSSETLNFAIDMLSLDDRLLKECITAIERIFSASYQKGASEISLALWQGLHDRKMKQPNPNVIHFEHANLSKLIISGLNFTNAIFDHATLQGTRFKRTVLQSASFKNSSLVNAEFLSCNAHCANFSETDAVGSIWRNSHLQNSLWDAAHLRLASFVQCNALGSRNLLMDSTIAAVHCNGINNTPLPNHAHISIFTGHSDWVTSCAISADNKRIVSGSNDNTLKVWDMESGNCLMTLANPPNNETASWDEQQQNVLFLSDNAWRWVGLSAGIRRLPIELLDAKLPC